MNYLLELIQKVGQRLERPSVVNSHQLGLTPQNLNNPSSFPASIFHHLSQTYLPNVFLVYNVELLGNAVVPIWHACWGNFLHLIKHFQLFTSLSRGTYTYLPICVFPFLFTLPAFFSSQNNLLVLCYCPSSPTWSVVFLTMLKLIWSWIPIIVTSRKW